MTNRIKKLILNIFAFSLSFQSLAMDTPFTGREAIHYNEIASFIRTMPEYIDDIPLHQVQIALKMIGLFLSDNKVLKNYHPAQFNYLQTLKTDFATTMQERYPQVPEGSVDFFKIVVESTDIIAKIDAAVAAKTAPYNYDNLHTAIKYLEGTTKKLAKNQFKHNIALMILIDIYLTGVERIEIYDLDVHLLIPPLDDAAINIDRYKKQSIKEYLDRWPEDIEDIYDSSRDANCDCCMAFYALYLNERYGLETLVEQELNYASLKPRAEAIMKKWVPESKKDK